MFLSFLIYLLFIIKLLFIFLSVWHLRNKLKKETNTIRDKTIVYWKERLEFIFVFLMSILLIVLFNPRQKNPPQLTYETRLLLSLFGVILLITADWKTFFQESVYFTEIQSLLR